MTSDTYSKASSAEQNIQKRLPDGSRFYFYPTSVIVTFSGKMLA